MALRAVVVGPRTRNAVAVALVVGAEGLVDVIRHRRPRAGAVHVVVEAERRPAVVALLRETRKREEVEPAGEVEVLHDDLVDDLPVRVGHARLRRMVLLHVADELRLEGVELAQIARVVVGVRQLLLDAAAAVGAVAVAGVLERMAHRIVAAEVVLEQLVLEPVGVEAELVELAVQLRADRIAERDVLPGLAAQVEREARAQARGIGVFREHRRLAALDRLAVKGVRAGERLALEELEGMALLGETRRRVAAQINAHVVVVEPGLGVVDAAEDAVRVRRRDVLLLLVHVVERVLLAEEVPGRERGRDLVLRRLDDRAVPLVAVLLAPRGRRAPAVARLVGDDGRPLQQPASLRQVGRRNRRLVSRAGRLVASRLHRHRQLLERHVLRRERAIHERHVLDRVVLGGRKRVHHHLDCVVRALRGDGERLPIRKIVLHPVQRSGVRTIGDGARHVVRRALRRLRQDDARDGRRHGDLLVGDDGLGVVDADERARVELHVGDVAGERHPFARVRDLSEQEGLGRVERCRDADLAVNVSDAVDGDGDAGIGKRTADELHGMRQIVRPDAVEVDRKVRAANLKLDLPVGIEVGVDRPRRVEERIARLHARDLGRGNPEGEGERPDVRLRKRRGRVNRRHALRLVRRDLRRIDGDLDRGRRLRQRGLHARRRVLREYAARRREGLVVVQLNRHDERLEHVRALQQANQRILLGVHLERHDHAALVHERRLAVVDGGGIFLARVDDLIALRRHRHVGERRIRARLRRLAAVEALERVAREVHRLVARVVELDPAGLEPVRVEPLRLGADFRNTQLRVSAQGKHQRNQCGQQFSLHFHFLPDSESSFVTKCPKLPTHAVRDPGVPQVGRMYPSNIIAHSLEKVLPGVQS